jgi:hypothetical protein
MLADRRARAQMREALREITAAFFEDAGRPDRAAAVKADRGDLVEAFEEAVRRIAGGTP